MKDKILQKLKECSPAFVSGEALSVEIGVSRTAVWKCIKELKNEGYQIDSSPRKGYKLQSFPDILSTHEICYNLETKVLGKKVHYFNVIDSTNIHAKKIASEGCEDGTLVVAATQTQGRGRLGRAWASADNQGIWMTIVLRPAIAPQSAQIITIAASTAIAAAIKRVTGIECGIKWPNDIVLDGKKVCGILTEMSAEMEQINYIVLGIGINVNQEQEDFPESLRDTAISLKAYAREKRIGSCEMVLKRSEIIKEILFELEQIYNKINEGSIIDVINSWKKYCVTLGKEVRVSVKGIEYTGIAQDVTDDGRLVISCHDGVKREIFSGEVSVRGMLGYV